MNRECIVFPHGEAALVVLPGAVECPTCHRAVRLVINRNGRTRCVACDEITNAATVVQTSGNGARQ